MDPKLPGKIPGETDGLSLGRRGFLAGLAALGGQTALAAATGPELLVPKNAGPSPASTPTNPSAPLPSPNDVGKVTNIRDEMKEYKDPKTGAKILQLTSNGSFNNHPYFTSESFLGDDASNTILVSNRSGRAQWYMLEVKTGKLVQLTAGQKVHGACVSRNGKLFYFDGPVLHYLNIGTMKDQELHQAPKGFNGGGPTCTADGRYVAYTYGQEENYSTARNVIYSTMMEEYYLHPHCVVMRVDTEAATAMACWGEVQNISHTLIHPTQPNIIVFCHEGGHLTVHQRMWTIDVSHNIARAAKPLLVQPPGHACVHEFFTRQGEVGVQYTIIRDDQMEEFNAFVRPDGTWIRQYRYPDRRPGHFQANTDNSVCIGDCAYFNPKDDDGDKYLALMTHSNGLVHLKRLAYHGSSWKSEGCHPHPMFSPDDRWVVYNSDVDGQCNVYMADTSV